MKPLWKNVSPELSCADVGRFRLYLRPPGTLKPDLQVQMRMTLTLFPAPGDEDEAKAMAEGALRDVLRQTLSILGDA
jgi:hypothetical protein